MSNPLDFDPTPPKLPEQPALVVDPIHGVLPYDSIRNPLTRSNTAHRVSMSIATLATNGQPKVYHFESEAESAVALEALLSPELYGLEVQLDPIYYRFQGEDLIPHHFDLRLTHRDGFRCAVFVRNASSLARQETQDEIDAIFASIPKDFADRAIVVNGNHYTRAYRDNLRRMWHLMQRPDADADAHVSAVAHSSQFWFLKDLTSMCNLPPATAWKSAMRLIARGVIGTNWHAVINTHSRIWLNG